jgi:hypothetical protein
MEVKVESHFLNIVLVDPQEADDIEAGIIGPRHKFGDIIASMKIMTPRSFIDVNLTTVYRMFSRTKRSIKMLRARFNDSISAGRVYSQILKFNKKI